MALPDRFWDRIEVGDCWLWTSTHTPSGYGVFRYQRRTHLVHRLIWETLVGAIPPGMHIDHLCRVRDCLNPDHLQPVTPAENNRRTVKGARGLESGRQQRARTHCKHGHEFNERNTYWYAGHRECRICRNDAAKRHKLRSRG